MSASVVVMPEMLARLSPLGELGPEGLQQAASLARYEVQPRSLQTQAYPWRGKVVYLLEGELKLGFPDGSIRVIVAGHGAALSPLGRGCIDPVHYRAITEVALLCFDENALDIIVTWDQLVPPSSVAGTVPAETDDGIADWRTLSGLFDVRRLTLGSFASLPVAHIEQLLACFRRQVVRPGEIIVRQGGPGDYYYLIESGRAQVSREIAGAHIDLAELRAGDAFGEEALLSRTSRNATVTMKTEGTLLRLNGTDFTRLLREPLLQRINAAEARRRCATGAVWLDVRFPAEYRHDGLPGALNIPLNELRDTLPNLRRDREYVVYCQSGRRSSAAAFLLSQHGLRASLLEGGLRAMTVDEEEMS